MKTWWIVKGHDILGSWPTIITGQHLMLNWQPVLETKTRIGPYWTWSEAARVLRLWRKK